MANTYTQIHIQAIFAVKKRTGLIQKEWKDELYKYITGIKKSLLEKSLNGPAFAHWRQAKMHRTQL